MVAYHRSVPRRLSLVDVALVGSVFALLIGLVRLGTAWGAPQALASEASIRLEPAALPYYVGRSLLRMLVAFSGSVVFSVGYAYWAARSPRAERLLIPALDVLQSVPVLGFLSVAIPALTGLFPGRTIGLELASIFAIFTSQAWNLAFACYHALRSLPTELELASRLLRLNPWQRFVRFELPGSMIPLVFNGMMSFGGGWFFLAASEAITVLDQRLLLPGLGSYLAVALERADGRAMACALGTMAAVILAVDQLMWRPLVAWSEKFKVEETPSAAAPSSPVLMALRRSALVELVERHVLAPAAVALAGAFGRASAVPRRAGAAWRRAGAVLRWAACAAGAFVALRLAWHGAWMVARLGAAEATRVAVLGLLTMGRVAAAVALGVLWTLPVGVAIGLEPKLAATGQPLVQLAAAFPANMLFPLVTVLTTRLHVDFEVGSILLMTLGTQWYILFNVIAGASAVPEDLKEAAAVFGIHGLPRWRRVVLPATLPSLVTGCLTAAGGAWNASIIAEVTTWGTTRLAATGLGAYITQVAETGEWAGIIWGVTVMATLVVLVNRLIWRPLYAYAERRANLGG